MTRFVVDASAVLHVVSAGIEISRGEMPADVARQRLARIGRPIRLLGDAVLRRRELADQLGWASTYNAEPTQRRAGL
jgi:hypothetical protein